MLHLLSSLKLPNLYSIKQHFLLLILIKFYLLQAAKPKINVLYVFY